MASPVDLNNYGPVDSRLIGIWEKVGVPYSKVTKDVLCDLQAIVGEHNVFVEKSTLERYSHDENSSNFKAFPEVVVKPQNTDQVSQVLQLANRHIIPVTFRGQGTGISCGAVPLFGGILMTFEDMNRILEIDEGNLVVVVEAGVVLLHLRQTLENRGLFYPADPGEWSSAIGGNVNTNAGGINGVKYGNTRRYVLGLEAVLPSGTILQLGGKTIKRSTGYELLHLIIGSEGTLAAVTKVILRLIKLPKYFVTLLVPFPTLRDAINTVPQIIRQKITPVAIEFVEREPLQIVEEYVGKTISQRGAEAYLIIRIDGDTKDHLYEVGTAIADLCMNQHALDVLIADTSEAQQRIWDIRSRFYEALSHNRVIETVDTVIPISTIAEYMAEVKDISKGMGIPILGLGHAGDGNVHLILAKEGLNDQEWATKMPQTLRRLYETAVSMGGTISGEHGIGSEKKEYVPIAISQEALKLMQGIKQMFDPNNILNPGKIFDMDPYDT